MAFWGVEIKPGKPMTHSSEKAGGRLRISQATLGFGEASKKTVIQCNVGNRSPVLLCALLPNKTESCQLDLEFEEADDVVFSVVGPRSVHLTGYYTIRNRHTNSHSDTESYGEDIENTESNGSSYCSDDDTCDSFINDDVEVQNDDEIREGDALQVSPDSPVLSKGMHEVTLDNDKLEARKGRVRHLKKKYRVIESDSDVNLNESEHEDCSLSVLKSKTALMTTTPDAGERIVQETLQMDDEAKDSDAYDSELKQKVPDDGERTAQVTLQMDDGAKDDGPCYRASMQKINPTDIIGKMERVTTLPLDEEMIEVNNAKNEIAKDVETLDELISYHGMVHGHNTKDTIINENLSVSNENDMQSLDLGKPKKKRKERPVNEVKSSKVQNDNEDDSVPGKDEEPEFRPSTDQGIGENYLVNLPEIGSIDGQKVKKKRDDIQFDRALVEGDDENFENVPNKNVFAQGLLLLADSLMKDLSATNGEYEEHQRLEETSVEGIGPKCTPMEDEPIQEPQVDSTAGDLPLATGDIQGQQIDANNITVESGLLANDNQLDKKTKKKKKKTQVKRDLKMGVIKMTENQETLPVKCEGQSTKAIPIQQSTLSNGLIIEELESGPPEGKVAVPGKKVKIHYTAMVKESGYVFDSNVGQTAFKYRLGDDEFIDGWNVGINGMRVGDKRRLIIPPSMGFGDHAMGENVPPNSWLVYDIKLVSVRR